MEPASNSTISINFSDVPITSGNVTFMTSQQTYSPLRLTVLILSTYFIPVIVVCGVIGNFLSLLVFVGTYLRQLSLSVYLAALALSDIVFLLTVLTIWSEYVDVSMFHRNGWCQTTIFLSYCSSFLSAWFVVSFTVERYIAVCHPLKRPELCTAARARLVVLSLTVFSMLGFACTIWMSGVVNTAAAQKRPQYVCQLLKEFFTAYRILTYIDTVVTLLVPFLLTLVLNITIACSISYFYKRRKRAETRFRTKKGPEQGSLCSRAQFKVTKMVLLLSSVSLLISFPSYVIRIRFTLASFLHQTHNITQTEQLLQQLFQLLYYCSFAVNFFLYSLCSPKFREALLSLWGRLRDKSARLTVSFFRVLLRTETSTVTV